LAGSFVSEGLVIAWTCQPRVSISVEAGGSHLTKGEKTTRTKSGAKECFKGPSLQGASRTNFPCGTKAIQGENQTCVPRWEERWRSARQKEISKGKKSLLLPISSQIPFPREGLEIGSQKRSYEVTLQPADEQSELNSFGS